MTRSQHVSGNRTITSPTFAANAPIKTGSDSIGERALEALVENQNTHWAQASPIQIMGVCAHGVLGYVQTPSGGGSLDDIYLTFMGRWCGDEGTLSANRNLQTWRVWAKNTDATEDGTIRIRSEGEADNLDLTINANTGWDMYTGTVEVKDDGGTPGTDVITVRMAIAGEATGEVQLRTYGAYLRPLPGELPTGIAGAGDIAHDLLEVQKDEALSVDLVRRCLTNGNLAVKGRGPHRPIAGWCHPMLHDGSAISGKAVYGAQLDSQFRPVTPPIMVPRWHHLDRLRYYLFGASSVADATVRVSLWGSGTTGVEHTLPLYVDETDPDPTAVGDWLTGTIAIQPATKPEITPGQFLLDKLRVEVRSDGVANHDGWVWGVVVMEDPE